MKANIIFKSDLFIPKMLPHQEAEESDDIFGDNVGPTKHDVYGDVLCLSSNHGSTYFWEWRDEGDHYIVPADSRAFYEGARNALNAVWGITFPSCEVTQVQSTIGHFETLYDYEQARRLVLPFMKNVERFLAAQHNSSDSSGGCLCRGSDKNG